MREVYTHPRPCPRARVLGGAEGGLLLSGTRPRALGGSVTQHSLRLLACAAGKGIGGGVVGTGRELCGRRTHVIGYVGIPGESRRGRKC